MQQKRGILNGIGWNLLSQGGVQGVQFIVSMVLARLLEPEHYGMVAIMSVLISLSSVVIESGFNTSLIQGKDVEDEDFSSVFWLSVGMTSVIYALLYLAAPLVARYYRMPQMVWPFRVMALVLFPATINSIQVAKISRDMDFKKAFTSRIGAIFVSGAVGVAAAYCGAGVWALVIQYLTNMTVSCMVMWFTVKWRPRLVCNMKRIRPLFSFGWKLLVSELLNSAYNNLRSLVIGKKFSGAVLGYYNRGQQNPQIVIDIVNGSMKTVLLSAMAARQKDRRSLKEMVRNSVSLTSYIVFPMMAGLAGVAEPIVRLLYTDKWLPAVPFMQVYCMTLALLPMQTSCQQAINAIGKSDVYLKLEILKKVMGVALLAISVLCFSSPVIVALSGTMTALLSSVINAYPCKRLFGYTYGEQIRDVVPSLAAAVVMCGVVLQLGRLPLDSLPLVCIQIMAGAVTYVGITAVARLKPFQTCMSLAKRLIAKKMGKVEV